MAKASDMFEDDRTNGYSDFVNLISPCFFLSAATEPVNKCQTRTHGGELVCALCISCKESPDISGRQKPIIAFLGLGVGSKSATGGLL